MIKRKKSPKSLPRSESSQGLHLNRDWLYDQYVNQQRSTYDIAKIVHRNAKRVYEKLREFGIQTRKRGENLRGPDNFMQSGKPNPFAGKKHSDETRKILSEKASIPKPHLRGSRNGMFGRCGAKNPRWIDGSSPERQTLYARSFWKELTRIVYERDKYQCVRCSSPHTNNNRLHAHHIQPWAGNPDSRFDLRNIVTLCQTCHQWVHSKQNTKLLFLPSTT